MEEQPKINGEFIKICSIHDLLPGGRKRLPVDRRDITLFRLRNGEIFAIDSVCYRKLHLHSLSIRSWWPIGRW